MKSVVIKCQTAASRPLNSLEPFQGKLKSLSQENYQKLRKLIVKHGFSFPVFVWTNEDKSYLLDGHQRTATLKRMRDKEGYDVPDIPVVEVEADDWKAAREKLLAATSAFGKIESQGLYEYISESEIDVHALDMSFDFPDIDMEAFKLEFFDGIEGYAGLTDENEDELPEPAKDIHVQQGDIYLLGGTHRLMCGDSTSETDLDALLNGEKFEMLLTDPPYNVDYTGGMKLRENITNDKFESEGQFCEFLTSVFSNAVRHHEGGGAYYVWMASMELKNTWAALDASAYQTRQILIWNKHNITLGRQDYHWKHEACLYGWREGSHRWYSDRSQTTVIDCKQPGISKLHPTMKPVSLFQYQMENSTKAGDLVLDAFGGSGTTLIAAHKIGRRAALMELDPGYCQSILDRYRLITGGDDVVKLGEKL